MFARSHNFLGMAFRIELTPWAETVMSFSPQLLAQSIPSGQKSHSSKAILEQADQAPLGQTFRQETGGFDLGRIPGR